jgi:hypothetical protein
MAFTYTGSTTFAEAVDKEVTEFNLTTTTGVSVGMILVTPAEVMQVRAIPVAGRVSVRRGYEGTFSGPHDSGETVYFGLPSDYAQIKDNTLRMFGPSFKLPDICIPGARGIDMRGYEYILVDSTASIVPGATVLISKDGNYTAAVLTSAGAGNVGVLMEDATSDQWAWAMIRGRHTHVKLTAGSSLMTSTGLLRASTEVSTPAVGLRGATSAGTTGTTVTLGATGGEVYRMWPASATTSASTSATSETGAYCTVWMEYPFVQRRITS